MVRCLKLKFMLNLSFSMQGPLLYTYHLENCSKTKKVCFSSQSWARVNISATRRQLKGGFRQNYYQQKSPHILLLSSSNWWGRVGGGIRTSSSSSFFYRLAVAKFYAMRTAHCAALLFVLLNAYCTLTVFFLKTIFCQSKISNNF